VPPRPLPPKKKPKRGGEKSQKNKKPMQSSQGSTNRCILEKEREEYYTSDSIEIHIATSPTYNPTLGIRTKVNNQLASMLLSLLQD